jgi:uncharacterized membrane protein
MLDIILLATTGVLTSLLAGAFFGYAVSVNGGLHRLKDSEYVRAMQSINIVIQNPLFFLSFMGPVALLPIVTFMFKDSGLAFMLLLAATIIYIVGAFGLTVAGNVPLNEKLAKVDAQNATSDELATVRRQFEQPWNGMHTVRTLASIVATVLLFAACIVVQ